MNTRLFLSLALAAGLPAVLSAQTTDPATQAQPVDPQSTGPAQLTDAQTSGPQGYLDPKPHAGTPLQPDGTTPPPSPQSQLNEPPQWYKDSPQAYDRRTAKPRRLHAAGKQLQVYDDSPPARQVAQEEPPPQDMAPSQPNDSQKAPHVQNLPRYYGQPDQQTYAAPQPQQGSGQQDYGQQNYGQQDNGAQSDQDYPQDDYGPSAGEAGQVARQPLSPEQLEQLVAPIALYPDQLVAQILTASTYPAQITAADQFVRSMNGAAPEQIAQGTSAQTAWDPSIKALTAFPQVLAMLDSNLQWTAGLGNAYYNQPQDVLETIQVLRQRAAQSGNLQSTPQQQVVQQPNYIQIQPANPEYVYVPSYNPWYVYGAPIAPYPSFDFGTWGLYIGGGIEYGLGFAMAPFFRMPYAFGAWGLNWMGGGICFNHSSYWTHSHEVRDWGFAHGGRRWDGGHGWGRGGYGGRDYASFGNYHNQPLNVHNGNGFNRSPIGRGFGGPQQPFGGRTQQGFGHFQSGGTTRPQAPGQQAYGRPEPFQGRPQPYGGQSFAGHSPMQGGSQAFTGRPQAFAPRPEPYRGQPQQFAQAPRSGNGFAGYPRLGQGPVGRSEAYRPPQQNYAPRTSGGGSNGWGQSFARPQQPSHFGGGYSAPSYGGGSRSFSGGGGHSYSGGGARSYSGGGGHSYSGGGGHSGGGGGRHR